MSTAPKDDDEMVTGDVFRAMREASQEKRRDNRQHSAALLQQAGVSFRSKNLGAHLIVNHNGIGMDFWPGTGKWATRRNEPKRSGRGVFSLLRFLNVELPEDKRTTT